jgi:PHP family Zn ribbon phosphoesterase
MLQAFFADLHIHSCLSPCAEREMTPEAIFSRAIALGLQIIAITDHNSTANLPAFLSSHPPELYVIPGMEVQTREEVHLVCLFPRLEAALAWGELVKAHLPAIDNNPEFFGEQTIVNSASEKTGEERRLLLNSVSFSIDEVVQEVHTLGGIAYPAHIDRPSYSVLSQLGFLPPGLRSKVFELSRWGQIESYQDRYCDFCIVRSSDAHRLSDLNETARSLFHLQEKSWPELVAALQKMNNRIVTVC